MKTMHTNTTSRSVERRGRLSRLDIYGRLADGLEQLRRIGGLPAPVEAQAIWGDIWYAEVHHSTAIEGNTLVLKEVKIFLQEGRPVGSKPFADYLEVQGYADAAKWVYDQARIPAWGSEALLTLAELRYVHQLVMEPVWERRPHDQALPAERPGNYRRHDIEPFPGGMVPPAWTDVDVAVHDWVDTVRNGPPEGQPFPEILANWFAHFERIHPFLDGNGRTGRLLMNLVLVRLGYPPAIIYKRDREKYLAALRKADSGFLGPLGEFFARAILDTLHKFVLPTMAGPGRLVPIASLADTTVTLRALRAAAIRGRLQAQRESDGQWYSTRTWVDAYKGSRQQTRNGPAVPTVRICQECKSLIHNVSQYICPGCGVDLRRDDEIEGARVLDNARSDASLGRFSEAHRQIIDRVHQERFAGRSEVAFDLLRTLKGLVPEFELSPSERAWTRNAEGLVALDIRRYPESERAFYDMRSLGEEAADSDVISTADQNLGALAYTAGDHAQAQKYYERSVQLKVKQRDIEGATQLLLNIASLATDRGDIDDAEALLASADELIVRGKLTHLRCGLHGNLGNLFIKREDRSTAKKEFSKALRAAKRMGDLAGEMRSLQNLGTVAFEGGYLTIAIRRFREGLRRAVTGNLPAATRDLNRLLAGAFDRAGQRSRAAEHLTQAQQLAAMMNDRVGWAEDSTNLGLVLGTTGQASQGLALLEQARNIFRATAQKDWEQRCLYNAAVIHHTLGDGKVAIACLEEALSLLSNEELSDQAKLMQFAFGISLDTRGIENKATEWFKRLEPLQKQLLSSQDFTEWLCQSAAGLSQHGSPNEAAQLFDRALKFFEESGNLQATCTTLNDRALALMRIGSNESAYADLIASRERANHLGDRRLEWRATLNLSELERQRGHPTEAENFAKAAIRLADELEDPEPRAASVCALAMVYDDDPHTLDIAFEKYSEALVLAKNAKSIGEEAMAVRGMATVTFARGRYAQAKRWYLQAARLWKTNRDMVHHAEAIAGAIESASAQGNATELDQLAEQLMDLVQGTDLVDTASIGFARSAGWWLKRGNHNKAAELYEAAFSVILTHDSNQSDETQEESSVTPMLSATIRVLIGILMTKPASLDALTARVNEIMNERSPALGPFFTELKGVALPVAQKALYRGGSSS